MRKTLFSVQGTWDLPLSRGSPCKAPGTCPCPVGPPEEPHPLLMGLENISVRLFKVPFFCPSVLHFVEARVHRRTGKCRSSQEEDAFGSGTQEDQMQCGVKRLVKGWVCGGRGHRGKGSTAHYMYRTPLDMTGHDRTQPDTKPYIPDTDAHDTVQNTPHSTGHHRT